MPNTVAAPALGPRQHAPPLSGTGIWPELPQRLQLDHAAVKGPGGLDLPVWAQEGAPVGIAVGRQGTW